MRNETNKNQKRNLGFVALLVVAILATFLIAPVKEPKKEVDKEKHLVSVPIEGKNRGQRNSESRTSVARQSNEVKALQRLNSKLTRTVQIYESKIAALQQELNDKDSGTVGENLSDNVLQMKTEEEPLEALTWNTETVELEHIAEAIDPEWADSATEAVLESFNASIDDAIELLTVECRSTTCRLEFAVAGDSWIDGLASLQELLPWQSELAVHDQDPNSNEAIVYIARDNHSLYSN